MGEDEHRVELGVQTSSLWKEASQDLYQWKGILLEEKPKRDSKKQENPLSCSSSCVETFCILFLDTFKVYGRVVWWLKVVCSSLAKGSVKGSYV